MASVDIGGLADFPEGSGTALMVDGQPLAVFRAGNRVFVVENRCPHRRFPLHDGIVGDNTVRCRTHGSCFSLETGEVLRGPARRGIAVYRVDVVDGRVVIEFGE